MAVHSCSVCVWYVVCVCVCVLFPTHLKDLNLTDKRRHQLQELGACVLLHGRIQEHGAERGERIKLAVAAGQVLADDSVKEVDEILSVSE